MTDADDHDELNGVGGGSSAEPPLTATSLDDSTSTKHVVACAMGQIRNANDQLTQQRPALADVVQAVVALDAQGRIRLEFEASDDDTYDISELQHHDQQVEQYEAALRDHKDTNVSKADVPTMAICIMIVGTRGDVQPFVAIAKRLQEYGHRVRLATHGVYREFVTRHGVEFYPLGGDPKELAAYMVKTGGHLIPLKYETLTKDVPRKMHMISEILHSTWSAVSAPDPDAHGPGQPGEPFQAQAIISNPVTYGHIHVAERLGVPLHIMFPQPWVPTVAFPHPLANMPYDDKPQKRNYMSYKLVDLLMWQGIESIVNPFRTQVLGLRKIRKGDGGRDMLLDLAIPHAFMWSPALVPKPADWGDTHDVVGTVLLKGTGSTYMPTPELEAFLGSDGGPIFVGFGSMVIADPKATTSMIIEAARLANVRVLIQSSWSDMAAGIAVPDNIFFIGNCPHDWLMPRVAAVVHHGGAGTTAAGLLAGKPTFIVPFFGDQPFWGRAVVRAGVGVEPCPIGELSVDKLHQAFVGLQTPEIRARALALREKMVSEDGAGEAVQSFYRHLPLKVMRCEVCTTQLATKWSEKDNLRLCVECEYVITSRPENSPTDIREYQCVDYRARGPNSALKGVVSGTGAFLHELVGGCKDILIKPAEGFRDHGATGAVVGLTKGLVSGAIIRPFQGFAILADHVATGVHNGRRDADEHKVGSVWLDNAKIRGVVGYKTAPMAHTASMGRNQQVLHKKTPHSGTIEIVLSDEEKTNMTAKLRSILAQRQMTPANSDDLCVFACEPSDPTGNSFEHSMPESLVKPLQLVDTESRTIPKMNICLLTTGTWSETVQQYVAIGLRLKADGHRVRIATHEVHRDRITRAGLEFFPLGGSTTAIERYLAFCTDSHDAKRGFFSPYRKQPKFPEHDELKAFIFSQWPACVEQDPVAAGIGFRADMIIAHPLVFGHTIVAERLGVPLHCMSTTPLSLTEAFPHPLTCDATDMLPFQYTRENAATYDAVDTLLWNGMHDILDSFRASLGLIGPSSKRNLLQKWRIPHTYLWNAELLPKPSDWGAEITIAGGMQLQDPTDKSGPNQHASWLATVQAFVAADDRAPIIYFGVVVDWESAQVDSLITEIEATARRASVRVIFQTSEDSEMSPCHRSVEVLEVPGAVPIKLLAPYVVAAVHWGDASVVSSWLTAGVPSCAIPRNPMQRIWGEAIAQAGVGVEPLDPDTLSSTNLAHVFDQLLHLIVRTNARFLRELISTKTPIDAAVQHIYDALPVKAMQCDLDPTRVARVYDPKHELKLSYEAQLVVQSQTHSNSGGKTEHIKYKPLKYTVSHEPRYFLRQLEEERRECLVKDGISRAKTCSVRAGTRNRSFSNPKKLARTESKALNVVESPGGCVAQANWTAQVTKINAAYEKLLANRSVEGAAP